MNPLDRIKQLRADLARAEDELSTSRVYLNELHGEHDKAVEELAALRARTAELEKDRDDWKKCADLAERALASEQRRSAELKAALWAMDAAFRNVPEGCDHSVGVCWCTEIRALDTAARALARAESATPLPMREDPRYRGTDFRSAIDVDRASQGGGK